MNKKISNEIAIGIILLLSILFFVIFLLQNKKQEILDNAPDVAINAPIKLDEKKDEGGQNENLADNSQIKNQVQDLTVGFEKDPCKGHLYEGDVQLRGRYVQDTTYGDVKEWLFKVLDEDKVKLPIQIKYDDGRNVNDLLKIEDATPELASKLKQATDEKPETISVQGYYLHCEGGPIVSIEPAKLALGKYLKR